jgi:hypothetical protein
LQAAKSTPYSEPQIRDRIKDGRLKAIRVAGAIYVHVDDLDQFMKRHHPSPTQDLQQEISVHHLKP